MSVPVENKEIFWRTLSGILSFVYNSIKAFFMRAFHLIFKPRSYSQKIKIGSEKDFFDSLNFLFVSISFYIMVSSVFLWIDPDHIIVQGRSIDVIYTIQKLLVTTILGLSCYFVLRYLSSAEFNFKTFMHCWFHVSAGSILLGIESLFIDEIYTPPVSGHSEQFLNALATKNYYGVQELLICSSDIQNYICRFTGNIGGWSNFISNVIFGTDINITDNPVEFTEIANYVIYFIVFSYVLIAMVSIAWIIHVQAIVQKYTLKISYIASFIVILYFNLMLALLILLFPNLGDLLGVAVPGNS